MPLVIICILLVLSIILKSKRWKNSLLKLGIGLLLFFSNDFIANEIVLLWEVPATPYTLIQKKYGYGIVLTGVGKSEMEPADRFYFNRGADRVTHTLQLYKLGIIKKIVISGGNGKLKEAKRQEADEMKDVFLMMGVPVENILVENKSRNTYESAIEVKVLFQDKIKPEDCLLITSAYHIRRSRACYAKQGWMIDTFSTDFISHPRKFSPDVVVIPSMGAFGNWHALVKEWMGMLAYKLAGYI
jgi:uncharacterized SAM-binding protein YcdF (DUF218 family)